MHGLGEKELKHIFLNANKIAWESSLNKTALEVSFLVQIAILKVRSSGQFTDSL